MFNLETAIADWRQRMLTGGIKSPVPLEELEIHLRDEFDRQRKSGLSEPEAFEISTRRIGPPEMLKREFKKTNGTAMKKMGIVAVLIGAAMILRILTEHPDAAHLRKNEQVEWLIAGSAIVLFGLSTAFFINSGDARDVRWWKLVAITYSIFAAWISALPIFLVLTVPKYGAAVDLVGRIFTFAAVTMILLSVPGWRLGHGMLPLIQNRRTRTSVGITGCVLGPALVALFLFVIAPHLRYFAIVPLTWAVTVMAVLGGLGYGLAEAARRPAEAADS
jgi:hypothetical protein